VRTLFHAGAPPTPRRLQPRRPPSLDPPRPPPGRVPAPSSSPSIRADATAALTATVQAKDSQWRTERAALESSLLQLYGEVASSAPTPPSTREVIATLQANVVNKVAQWRSQRILEGTLLQICQCGSDSAPTLSQLDAVTRPSPAGVRHFEGAQGRFFFSRLRNKRCFAILISQSIDSPGVDCKTTIAKQSLFRSQRGCDLARLCTL
jgi:hypothetical protein